MLKNEAEIGQALAGVMAWVEVITHDPIQHKALPPFRGSAGD